MTRKEFDLICPESTVTLVDTEICGKPLVGRVVPSRMFNPRAKSQWSVFIDKPGLTFRWTPDSDEAFMKSVEIVN